MNHKCLKLTISSNKWLTLLTFKSLFGHLYAWNSPIPMCIKSPLNTDSLSSIIVFSFLLSMHFLAHKFFLFILYLNTFGLSRIMTGHKGMLRPHNWRLQWRGWQTSWIEFRCQIFSSLQLAFSILHSFGYYLFFNVSHPKKWICFTITTSKASQKQDLWNF